MTTFWSHTAHPQPGKLLTAREVAEVLGVHTETVLRYTRDGKLSAIRLPGGGLRYRDETLQAWLDESVCRDPGEETSYDPGEETS
ncbi:MAG: helix-turn-helix domain-containing protein [Solirubrobacteraceae bacterium]